MVFLEGMVLGGEGESLERGFAEGCWGWVRVQIVEG